MNFQILISTVNDVFFSRNTSLKYDHIIVNQLIDKNCSDYKQENLYSYRGKGLSESRNIAIKKSTADICLISDDDVRYKKNTEKNILQAFTDNPDAGIITFQVETPEGVKFKNYREEAYEHNLITAMKVSSVEIAFRRECLIENKIFFDESFGLGARFPTGEEAIFLSDAIKKGIKIFYVPIPIVVHPKESSGGDYVNPELAPAKGAMLYRVFGWKAHFLCLLFAIKHYKKTPYSLTTFLTKILYGAKTYKNKDE